MDESQQRQVAQGLREGRSDAWQALYDAFAESIWQSVARRLGVDATDIADVVQETFLAAARSARTYDAARGTLWHWLSGIARHQIALHYRRRSRREQLEQAEAWLAEHHGLLLQWLAGDEAAPWSALATAELAVLARAALSELPAEYERLLTTRYLQETSIEQIAAAGNVSTTAIRSKLTRARRAFHEVLTKSAFVSLREHAESSI